MRFYSWDSRNFYKVGLIMFLFGVGLTALCAVVGVMNSAVEARLSTLMGTLHGVGIMITGGLFHVAGAILATREQNLDDQHKP